LRPIWEKKENEVEENLNWHRRQIMAHTAEALEKNGMPTACFESREEAIEFLLAQGSEAESVGFGGSMTLAELGLPELFAAAGKKVLVHVRPDLSLEERRRIMQDQLNSTLFLTSANALTLKGHIVNIDATGNRVGAMVFGPAKVIIVAGVNKITADLESALRRIKEKASPPNARRLGFETPCAKTGLCSDCSSPQRICRVTTIIERKPRATDLRVCLINEDLGY
jgi:hypothetical protein